MNENQETLVDGIYNITLNGTNYDVYCSFDYKNGLGWTLFESGSLTNVQWESGDLDELWTVNVERNEDNVEYYKDSIYRMSKNTMLSLKQESDYLFSTCNFNTSFDNDHWLIKISDMEYDPFNETFQHDCISTTSISIRGNKCENQSVASWNADDRHFHTDSSKSSSGRTSCECTSLSPGSVDNEDDFGYYRVINGNFSCSMDNNSTTQWWFGSKIILNVASTCAEWMNENLDEKLSDGVYLIKINNTNSQQQPKYEYVYCSFDYPNGYGWTLFESGTENDLQHSDGNSGDLDHQWSVNVERNLDGVDFDKGSMYRLSNNTMLSLKQASEYIFSTCNFNTSFDNDHWLLKISDMEYDPFSEKFEEECLSTTSIKIRGNKCKNQSVVCWNDGDDHFHTDSSRSSSSSCECTSLSTGSVDNEDNFGHYRSVNLNFDCTLSTDTTTQWWFGSLQLPTHTPTNHPSYNPTIPSQLPSYQPTSVPTKIPSRIPSSMPSSIPSRIPSTIPSSIPSDVPTGVPSSVPSSIPSSIPSNLPSSIPSSIPSEVPTSIPSRIPSSIPTGVPSSIPTSIPSPEPSKSPIEYNTTILSTQENIEEIEINDLYEQLGSSILSIVLIILLIVSVMIGLIHAETKQLNGVKCFKKRISDSVQIVDYLAYLLQLWDFFTDINVCYYMFELYFKTNNENLQQSYLILGLLSAIFLILPMFANLYSFSRLDTLLKDHAPCNKPAIKFFNLHFQIMVIFCVISGNFYATLKLVNSGLFGLDTFNMGLAGLEIQRFFMYKVFCTTLLENTFQLIVAISFIIISKNSVDATILLSLVTTSLSLTITLMQFLRQFNVNIIELNWRLRFDFRSAVGHKDETSLKKLILKNQLNKKKLTTVLSEQLSIEANCIQIRYIKIIWPTVSISGLIYSIQPKHDHEQNPTRIRNESVPTASNTQPNEKQVVSDLSSPNSPSPDPEILELKMCLDPIEPASTQSEDIQSDVLGNFVQRWTYDPPKKFKYDTYKLYNIKKDPCGKVPFRSLSQQNRKDMICKFFFANDNSTYKKHLSTIALKYLDPAKDENDSEPESKDENDKSSS